MFEVDIPIFYNQAFDFQSNSKSPVDDIKSNFIITLSVDLKHDGWRRSSFNHALVNLLLLPNKNSAFDVRTKLLQNIPNSLELSYKLFGIILSSFASFVQ